MKYFYSLILLFCSHICFAQQDSTSLVLDSVTIHAYGSGSLQQTAAAVNHISTSDLSRFSNTNMLQAVNATPGVRMEERSPGSYRLNIRGSSVRSPYGVRNVKVYYDGIPLTAPGGATALNLFGFYNMSSLEVIKGPGASMYGAGTGGVLLINPTDTRKETSVRTGVLAGSYGLKGIHAKVTSNNNSISYEHLEADGYRDHSQMRRDIVSWDATIAKTDKNILNAHFLYSDLFYETPGALTEADYQNNPRAARPASAVYPSAEAAKAAINQQVVLAGFTNKHQFSKRLSNTTTLYGLYSRTQNPTIQNYERKTEPHFGGRSSFNYYLPISKHTINLTSGVEIQQSYDASKTYTNKNGLPDSLMVEDKVQARQAFGFLQAKWTYTRLTLSAGASINTNNLYFNRLSELPAIEQHKQYPTQLSPRFAALYRIHEHISAYMNVAKGYAPPATDEVFADNNSYNLALLPETSWNYEPGIRGSLFAGHISFDASVFTTGIENTIVTRRDAAGGNYYVNAGKTDQQGLEMALGYHLLKGLSWWEGSSLRAAYSHYRFRYQDFVQAGDDYSGNELPGVPNDNLVLMLDLQTKLGAYLNLTNTYTSGYALNDANTAYSESYDLLTVKLGYKTHIKKIQELSLFIGADNLLNQRYSLGYDINGFGGRYYNAAAGRSYYAGLNICLTTNSN